MPNRFHSSLILLIVFVLGTTAGVATMVWAWPGLKAKYFPARRPFMETMRRSLDLTPAQATQMQGVFKGLNDKRHALHLQYVPQYTKICEDYKALRTQERTAYAPIAQQGTDEFKAILTDLQWKKWEQQRQQDQKDHPPGLRPPDVCRQLPGAQNGQGGPGGPQGGGRGGPPSGPPSGPPPSGHYY